MLNLFGNRKNIKLTYSQYNNVKSFLLSNKGKLISSWNNSVKVSKEGLAEGLYDYSIEHPFLYGLLAALGAILAGYIASEVFRRI